MAGDVDEGSDGGDQVVDQRQQPADAAAAQRRNDLEADRGRSRSPDAHDFLAGPWLIPHRPRAKAGGRNAAAGGSPGRRIQLPEPLEKRIHRADRCLADGCASSRRSRRARRRAGRPPAASPRPRQVGLAIAAAAILLAGLVIRQAFQLRGAPRVEAQPVAAAR